MTCLRADRVGRLLDLAALPRWLTRSMLLAIALYFIGALGGAVYWSLGPDILASFVLQHLPVVAVVILIAIAVLRPAGWLGRIGVCVLVLVPFAWMASATLALIERLPAGWLWSLPAGFRLLFLAWTGVELLAATLALLSASRTEATLLNEPRLAPALMGAPPALAQLSSGLAGTRALFLAAAFVFAFAMLQFQALLLSPDFTWQAALTACGAPSEATRPCFTANAQGELSGQLAVWPLTFIGAIALGRWLERLARNRTRDASAKAMAQDDTTPGILFLRAFTNDQVELTPARPSLMRWLVGRTRTKTYLDHMLVEELAIYGPTVALGHPDQEVPPFGVWRTYLRNATDKQWQEEVAKRAKVALAIVMVADLDTKGGGVLWELEHIAAAGLRHKTLFIVPPERGKADNARLWQTVEERSGLRLPPGTADAGRPVLAAFETEDGAVHVATSERFAASDYLAALRWFFRTGILRPAAERVA